MIVYILIGAGILACGIFTWWFLQPATCPRCGDRPDPAHAGHLPDRATCSRCGCRYNPTTGAEL